MKQEAPQLRQPEPAAPAVVATPAPVQKPAEKGFLASYWMWLLGIIIAVVAVLWMKKKD